MSLSNLFTKDFLPEVGGKVSDFEQTKNFVCKDFEARDSSLNDRSNENEGSSSFSLKSQRRSSPYYNDSRVWLKSRGTQGFPSSTCLFLQPNIYIYRLKNLADTFKLSPNYFPAKINSTINV